MKVELVPSYDCEPDAPSTPERWSSLIGDPQFLLKISPTEIPTGLARLTLQTDPGSPAWVDPQVYFDLGDGFSNRVVYSLAFERSSDGRTLYARIEIPAGTQAIRLDPTSARGDFSLGIHCRLRRLSPLAFAAVRVWDVFRSEGLSGLVSRVLAQGRGSQVSVPVERLVHVESKADTGFRETLHNHLTGRHREYLGAPASKPPSPIDVKLLAFYLPQFHPIAENDAWWGRGFTEWTNVSKAIPRFAEHHQPHLPGELGFYDLRVPSVMRRQIELAKLHGLAGFCFYYYWFSGKRLLESPLEHFLESRDLDAEFCICWANENWSRRWDGSESDILMAQAHSADDDLAMIDDLARAFRDERYIRIDGKPVFVVYRVGILPEAKATAQRWRARCRENGLGEIYLVAAQTFGATDPTYFGFDAAMEFPPHGVHAQELQAAVETFEPEYKGKLYSYAEVAENQSRPVERNYPLHRTAMPGWDNTARKGINGNVFMGAKPSLFFNWVRALIRQAREENEPGHRLVFINAWNEWAEGAHLEPDRYLGYANLMACHRAINSAAREARPKVSVVMPVYNHEGYVRDAIASVLAQSMEDLELIVIDDCSRDGSYQAAVDALAELDIEGRATLNRMPINHDAFNVINFGISQARGEYIAIINSDDLWPIDRLKHVLDEMEKVGSELGFARIRLIDSDGVPVGDGHELAKVIKESQDACLAVDPGPILQLLRGNAAVTTGNLVFRQSLFEKIGPFAPLRLCHDWDFLLRSTYFTAPIFVDVHAYDYRVHLTNTFTAVDHLAESETHQVLSRFFTNFSHHPSRDALMADESFKSLVANDPYKSSWVH